MEAQSKDWAFFNNLQKELFFLFKMEIRIIN